MRKPLLILSALILSIAMVMAVSAPGAAAEKVVMRVIAKGAAIHGANGVYFDADDNLYVASVLDMGILVINPLNGKIIKRLGADEGIQGPDDLTFGPDGSLYWTDIMQGNVGRLSPDGTVTKQFIAQGVNPITFSEDGRLFVALDFMGAGLFELDPDLTTPPTQILPASLGFLNGFDFGPDGRLYGPLFAEHRVVSIDVDSPSDLVTVADGFAQPAAAKFDSQGRLHVVDQSGGVYRVNTSTGAKTVIAELSPGLDNLAFDSLGNLYVSNANDGSVTRVLPSGQGRILSPGGMISPGGVAVVPRADGRDAVFVADVWSLREFDGLTGKDMGFASSHLVGEGLTSPLTVSVDGDHLVLSSWLGGKVQVFDPQAEQVTEQYLMQMPLNAIRFQGDLLVSRFPVGLVWASTGLPVFASPTPILAPVGLVASGSTLLVGDWLTGMVWKVEFAGKTPGTPTPVTSGLVNPGGMALDTDGSLLVVEAGAGRLTRVDIATGTKSVVADRLELGAPGLLTAGFNGVAVGPSGAIYVTGDVSNVLYRIWPR